MNKISLNGKNYTAPSSWAEINLDQLSVWLRICNEKISDQQALMLATISFYQLPPKKFFILSAAQQIQLIDTLTFLVEENKLVKWMIPEIKSRFKKHIGPAGRLSNATIKEFRVTELYYNAYRLTKDEKMLDLLIAALYRPAGRDHPENDAREPLTELGVQRRAPVMAKLKSATREVILFNYEGCRAFVIGQYPTIFSSGDGASGNALQDLEGIIKTVAGGKFGAFNETSSTPLYLFLDHLRDEIEAARKIKQP